MKRLIDPFDYAKEITKAIQTTCLVTTKVGDKVNPMTIGWGMLGVEWDSPIFILFVREHRFTRTLLEKSGEFTVNVPYGKFDKKSLAICGSKSGRDTDKISELNLTLEPPLVISTPGIKEFPLTLECEVIYTQKQNPLEILPELVSKYHPQDIENPLAVRSKYFHTAYYGKIVSAYIIE